MMPDGIGGIVVTALVVGPFAVLVFFVAAPIMWEIMRRPR
jgi:hypothetical protein